MGAPPLKPQPLGGTSIILVSEPMQIIPCPYAASCASAFTSPRSWATIWSKRRRQAMTTKTVEVHEAQQHLLELVAQVAAGTEIILTDGQTPRARLVPLASATI